MAEKEGEDLEVRSMIEAAHSRSQRSPLYRWFWRHFDALEPEFRRPNWQAVADKANDLGLRAVGDRPVTKDTARQTFAKVREAKKAAPARPKPLSPIAPGAAAPPSDKGANKATDAMARVTGAVPQHDRQEGGGFTLPPAARPRDTGKKEDR